MKKLGPQVASYLISSLAAQTTFFFDIGMGKKGLVKWSVPTSDHAWGFMVTTKVLSS